jgi:hypothetical protein
MALTMHALPTAPTHDSEVITGKTLLQSGAEFNVTVNEVSAKSPLAT